MVQRRFAVIRAFPILAGQSWRYLYIELKDFNEGRRERSGDDRELQGAVRTTCSRSGTSSRPRNGDPTGFKADSTPTSRRAGRSPDAVLCPMCHGAASPTGTTSARGRAALRVRGEAAPGFQARGRTDDAGDVTSVARALSDQDIEDVAQYITTLN